MTDFWLADTHFGHKNIIRFSDRTWASNIQEHDQKLIDAWNSVVTSAKDNVYHLGDFAYKISKLRITKILEQLNGKIHLVAGNHDNKAPEDRFVWVKNYYTMEYNGRPLVMFHYPIASWWKRNRGSIHLHGHCNGAFDLGPNTLDVGVDSIGIYPITMDTILKQIRLKGEPRNESVNNDRRA